MELFGKLVSALGWPRPSDRVKGGARAEPNGRALARKRQRLQEGFIFSDGMLAPRACTLRDLTALGACVEIWDPSVKVRLLVGDVTLYLTGDRKEVDCKVMWRRDNALGLKFTSPFREPRRSYG